MNMHWYTSVVCSRGVGQALCTCGKIERSINIVHSDIQEVCRSSRIVTVVVLKFTGVR